MQKNQIVLMDALKQAEAGLEVAVGRISSDEKDRGDFKPSEVLALEAVRNALTIFDAEEGASDQRQQEQTVHSEPSSAEQAAWHAGLDAGRAQAAPLPTGDEIRAIARSVSTSSSDSPSPSEYVMAGYRAALAATPAAAPDLRAKILSTPLGVFGTGIGDIGIAYRAGHRAALLTAADLVSATPEAAVPVVLPEPDAAVKEVMGMATEFALLQAEARETLNELGECDEAAAAYESAKESRDALETKLIALLAGVSAPAAQAVAFQQRVQPWMMDCFGPEISADRIERNHRFLEEALELVQACGCTASEAHQLVDYVFGRPMGDKQQEVGGVMVTLAALCLAQGLDMHAAGDVELARIWTKVEAIRAKQAAKPKHSPLPMHAPQAQDVGRGEVLVTVSGFTGSGKSAIAGEIEILCRALGLQVDWPGGDSEKNMTHADWTAALEQYKPRVRIVEHNVPTSESKNDH